MLGRLGIEHSEYNVGKNAMLNTVYAFLGFGDVAHQGFLE
jgi:hypothetical protein